MIARLERSERPLALLALAAALGATACAVQMHGGARPWGVSGPIEIGNAALASLGAAWAGIQIWSNWRGPRRAAWICAAAGMVLIMLEAHLEDTLLPSALSSWDLAISTAMWAAASYLIYLCARRYAMRRFVAATALAGVGVGIVAQVLALGDSPALRLGNQAGEVLTVALFVLALLACGLAPVKSYRFPRAEIGRRGRALFYDFGVGARPRYPLPFRAAQLPILNQIMIVAIILLYAPRSAGPVHRAGGPTPFGQVLDMLRLGFVEGVDAKSYYLYEFWRPRGERAIEETLTRVETKNGLTRAIQLLRNDPTLPNDLNDKLGVWRILDAGGVPSAPILASVEHGRIERFAEDDAFDRDLFVKDRVGRGGAFTRNFRRTGRFAYRDDAGDALDLPALEARLESLSAGRRLIVQPKLANHPEIASLAEDSLIVFRVVTCLDRRGEPHLTHGLMRIIRRFEPTWPASPDQDWGAALDLETGVFGVMTGDAPETCTRWFVDHPLTGERVAGRRLDGWREIADTALAAHRVFSGRILIGWDIAWTPEGVRILEGNSNMDFSYFQRCYRTPVGRSPLGPLLSEHIDALQEKLMASA